ncbi:MAG: hypothetical protein KKG06_05055 [Bacteroidetes bacterium]|nr:hypothetical protein [Bacteroidota bacterium]MBU1422540.1 hypothetical protein [Bacteroidota bacterium]
MNDRLEEIRNRIASLSNTELIDMLEKNSHQYTPEALSLAREEVDKRGGLISERTQYQKQARPPTTKTFTSNRESGGGAIFILQIIAWLELVGAIIVAIFFLLNPLIIPHSTEIGLVIFFQGVFLCAFLLVVASIAENLIQIRKNTTKS